jgi:predicted NBD/HSP70 family sugar kinase
MRLPFAVTRRRPSGNDRLSVRRSPGWECAEAYPTRRLAGKFPASASAELLSLATSGDSGARRVIADAGRHIGGVVATLCDLFNPELIVVGGELGRAGDVLLDPMREQVYRHAIPATARELQIVPGMLGPRAELLGALALVLATSDAPQSRAGRSRHRRVDPF